MSCFQRQLALSFIIHLTHCCRYPWRLVKPIFLVKLDRMMREYNSKEPYDSIDQHTNCAKDTFDKLYSKVMVAADSFPQYVSVME